MKWNPGTLCNGHFLFSPIFVSLLLTLIASTSGCTLPSGGYFERNEDLLGSIDNSLKKNETNTKLLAENTTDEKKKAKWRKEHEEIPDPVKAPKDENSGDWIETLLYILLGNSVLGVVAKGGHALYKAKPKAA